MSTIRIRDSKAPEPRIADLLSFISERNKIFLRRKAGESWPWTRDEILQKYRFTNVHRELDRVTIWIRENIREPFADHPHLWFMLCMSRQINLPETLAELIQAKTIPSKAGNWDWKRACDVMRSRQQRGLTVYTAAYMLRGPIQGDPSGHQDKPHYTTHRVLLPIWEARSKIEPQLHYSLKHAHESLIKYHGWGDFLTAQVVADLKHTRYLNHAPDWWSWAILGPGSTRGLNRVLGRSVNANIPHEESIQLMTKIQEETKKQLKLKLCLQDVQNCLCEFSKYEKARLNEGRPKRQFSVS